MQNDPMIEKYKRELLEFSRRHPKFGGEIPQQEPQEQTQVQLEVQTETFEQPPVRLMPDQPLYREDFEETAEAVTTTARLKNVAQREALPQTPETEPVKAAAVPVHSDAKELEYAQCDASEPPYCNGTIATFPTREAFLEANPGYGYLRVQVSVAAQAYPVQNAAVEISKTFSGQKFVFFNAQTDASGIVSRVTLPAPDRDLSSAPSALQPYATYDIFISHPNFTDVYVPNCIVFATIETIQQVRMIPNETCEENPEQPFCEEE